MQTFKTVAKVFAAAYLIATSSVAPAQPQSLTADDAESRAALEQHFLESSSWQFYYAFGDLPRSIFGIVSRVVGETAVGPGEPFDSGDRIYHNANSQHLYTAVNEEFIVSVWHRGTFSGPVTSAYIYRRAEQDSCRYNFTTTYAILSVNSELKSIIRDKRVEGAGCRYARPDGTRG